MRRLNSKILPNVKIETIDGRPVRLLERALSRIPVDVSPIYSVKRFSVRKSARKKEMVGLTTYCCVEYGPKEARGPSQRIILYRELMGQLSDAAATAVVAHELAHAWLNEHVKPEQSRRREREADELAREWGFSSELSSLESEAETVLD